MIWPGFFGDWGTDRVKGEREMETERELERLNAASESLNAVFYHDRGQPFVFTTMWGCGVSFDVAEVASVADDMLKQWVINRTVVMLREQIDHLESLR